MRLRDAPQPFQYQGSKRTIASAILSKLDMQSYSLLVEPFAGSAAVSIRAAMQGEIRSFWLNDANKPLIELWNAILDDTDRLINGYTAMWESQKYDPKEFYNLVRNRFNNSQEPVDLLYLLSRAVKGAVRYNSAGEFNQSPDNRRLGVRPHELARRLRRISSMMSRCTQTSSFDYHDLVEKYQPGQVWYMDPPYEGVSKQRDSRYVSTTCRSEFENFLHDLNNREVPFILSYDGQTGERKYGKPLPSELGLKRVNIMAGRSTTSTLLGKNEQTIEALYLSQHLRTKRSNIEGGDSDQMTINFAAEDYVGAS